MTTARQAAAAIFALFCKKWGEFKREVMDLQEVKTCRDKELAFKMAKAQISRWVWNTGAEDVEAERATA